MPRSGPDPNFPSSKYYIGHAIGTNSGIASLNATGPHGGGFLTNDNTANVAHNSTVADAELWDSFVAAHFNNDFGSTIAPNTATATGPFADDNTANVTQNSPVTDAEFWDSFIATPFNNDVGPTIASNTATATDPFADDNTGNVPYNWTEADADLYDYFHAPVSEYFSGPPIATDSGNLAPTTTTTPTAAPAATITTVPRLTCSHHACSNRTFSRASDLARHMKKHQPTARRYWCSVSGCKYSSGNGNGFYRRDELVSHQRNVHGVWRNREQVREAWDGQEGENRVVRMLGRSDCRCLDAFVMVLCENRNRFRMFRDVGFYIGQISSFLSAPSLRPSVPLPFVAPSHA